MALSALLFPPSRAESRVSSLLMKNRYYSPQISRLLVCALYHEAKRRRKPMTALTNELLREALYDSESLRIAQGRFAKCFDEKANPTAIAA